MERASYKILRKRPYNQIREEEDELCDTCLQNKQLAERNEFLEKRYAEYQKKIVELEENLAKFQRKLEEMEISRNQYKGMLEYTYGFIQAAQQFMGPEYSEQFEELSDQMIKILRPVKEDRRKITEFLKAMMKRYEE